MKNNMLVLFIILCLFYISSPAQDFGIEIPLGVEKNPSGNDSFIPYHKIERPKIALALSGGGARGLAQIGVLKTFEKYGIPIDGIAGTSMGAIIGGLYCTGYSASEIEQLSQTIRWNDIIQDRPSRDQLFLGQKEETGRSLFQLRLEGWSLKLPAALTAGQKFTSLITDFVLNAPYPYFENFDHGCIPFRAVATDLLTGKKVVLSNGSLIDAMHASMAIPLLFTPIQIDNYQLVDGGLVQNLPVSEAQSFGADLVIAVDTSSKLRKPNALSAPWEIADQVTTIMQQNQTTSQFESADIQIQPSLEGFSNTDFDRLKAFIAAGEEAAEKVISKIDTFLIRQSHGARKKSFSVKKVSILGCNKINPDSLLAEIRIDTNQTVSESKIIWTGQKFIQSGFFKNVHAYFDSTEVTLIFKVEENPYVEKIILTGNQIFPDSLLISELETKPNSILNIQKSKRDRLKLIDKYHREGYALAQIDTIQINRGVLHIVINEGRINRIFLKGNKRTYPFVVLRELPIKPGDYLNVSDLKTGLENIYSTGYFEGVGFNLKKHDQAYDLILNLKEQANTIIRFGSRYDLERQTQGFIEIAEENLLGFGAQGILTALYGNRDAMLNGCLWSNRFFYTNLTYKINLSVQSREHYYYNNHDRLGTYNQNSTHAAITIGQHMRRLGTVSMTVRSENIDLNPLSGNNTPNETYTLWNLTLKSEVDTRNKMPFPTKGKHHILEYETALSFLDSDISYVKLFSSMESYYRISSYLNFHPQIAWGTTDNTVPFSKQFFLGGMDSFQGLPEEAFTGKRFIHLNGELRFQFPWPDWLESYLTVHYDFGGIWNNFSSIKTEDFKHGFGILFSLNSPVGPIYLGTGTMSDGKHRYYLSLGHSF